MYFNETFFQETISGTEALKSPNLLDSNQIIYKSPISKQDENVAINFPFISMGATSV